MITVVEVNHGMGGPYDAKRKEVATFDRWEDARDALAERGYSVKFDGSPVVTAEDARKMIYHRDPERRNTMGAISYEFRGLPEPLPHNRLP